MNKSKDIPVLNSVDKNFKLIINPCLSGLVENGINKGVSSVFTRHDHIDTYIEPFIGAGALYFHLNHNKNVINDIHKEIYTFYSQCTDHVEEIIEKLSLWNNDEETFIN